MARAKNFLRGLGSGYLLLGCNALFMLVSVPLVLHYLGQERAGLWAVVSQMATYLAMIDLGTTGAGIRLLVDHKDTRGDKAYGSLIKSMVFTQFIQAALILALGFGSAGLLQSLLKIPPELGADFGTLWLWQVVILATNFAFRVGSQILTAHQRLDIANYIQLAALIVNFLVLVAAFQAGFKIYSFVFAQGFSTLVLLGWLLLACWRLKLFPQPGAWGSISRPHLKNLFRFGSDVFLVSLGQQFIISSQTILLTRLQGLEAAWNWSVLTKLFGLMTQLVWRSIGMAMPAFSEMLVRGENQLLARRYRSAFELSVLASCFFGVLIAVGNSAFVDLWMKHRIHWSPINDWLLALWFVLLAQGLSHNTLVVVTKRVQALKYVYFLEGAVFIVASVIVIPRAGVSGLLVCSILATSCFTLAYGTWRVARLLHTSAREIVFAWLRPAGRFLIVVGPVAILVTLLTPDSSLVRLAGGVVPLAILSAVVALRWCVPRAVMAEFISHLPAGSRRLAGLMAGAKPGAAETNRAPGAR